MKVSVIVPVYNAEKYIDRCVNSLINQNFNDYEIILINDGSTDNSSSICHKYEKENSNIIVIDQENKKDGGARNAGLKVAKGKYVTFVDSDDYIDHETLKVTYDYAESNNLDVLHFSTIEEDENGNILRKVPASSTSRINLPSCMKLIRKEYIPALFIENKYSNDFNFSMKLKNNYGKFASLPDCYFYHYVQNPSSVLHTSNPLIDIDSLYCMQEYKDWLVKNNRYNEDDYYYLVFHEVLISRATHALMLNHPDKKETFNKVIDFCHKEIPNYRSKPFYKKEILKTKIIAFVLFHKLTFIYKTYKNLKWKAI